jgi:glyoxylate reductase
MLRDHGHDIDPGLRVLPNVPLLPHMSSATIEGRLEMGEKVIANIRTFLDGHRPPDQVVSSML